jgi:hypothetical protein
MTQHLWGAFAIIWSSTIAVVVLMQVLIAQTSSSEFNWNAISIGVAVGLALSAAMTWDLRRGHHQPDKDTKP